MKKQLILYIALLSCACQSLDSVDLTERNTFIKFFGGPGTYLAADIKQTSDGGFIGVGTIETDTSESVILIKLDAMGNTEWDQIYDNTNAASVIEMENGYIIAGDRIQNIAEFESLSSMTFFTTDRTGNITNSNVVGDEVNELDFHTTAATVTAAGDLIVLGVRENEDDSESSVLISADASTLDIDWIETYDLINRNYSNGKSIYETPNGDFIWTGSAIIPDEDNFDTYVTIPVIEPGSQFVNNNLYGEVLPENHQGIDIAQSISGFGIVGSQSNEEDEDADILFLRTTQNGDVISNSAVVFNASNNDRGLALTNTSDGGYALLGSISTNTTLGNGGTDFYVIKTDFNGNEIWSRNFGGSGDEQDGVIRQTQDEGYIIFGTSELQGVSSLVLIKTDAQGELKN